MAVFAPNQREELLIGNSVSSESTVADFISNASNQEIGIYSKNGGDVSTGDKFYILQKTNGPAGDFKNLNYEFSDAIFPSGVTSVRLAQFSPELQKSVTVTGFTGTPQANATYEVLIRLYEDGGAMSAENFRNIGGYFVTDNSTVTNAEIVQGIVDNLNKSQVAEGTQLFTVINDNDDSIIIEGQRQIGDPAKDIADLIKFDVQVSVKSNQADANTSLYQSYNLLTSTITSAGSPGKGEGKYVANLEWFCRGYNYEASRQSGYPVNFSQPAPYADYNGTYNIIHINHYRKNSVAGVEEQPRTTTIAIEVNVKDLSTNAATNDVLDKLSNALGSTNINVPAYLPTA